MGFLLLEDGTSHALLEDGSSALFDEAGSGTVVNDFEGGTNGSTITTGNSGGTGETAFDATAIGAGSAAIYDTAHAAHGSLAAKFTTGAGGTGAVLQWSTSVGAQTVIYGRAYIYLTANPATSLIFRARATAGPCGDVYVTSAGKIRANNAAGSTVITTTNSIALNQWVRVEWSFTLDATTGVVELKLFNTADSTTATETLASAATQNFRGAADTFQFGIGGGPANVTLWADDIGLSPVAYLGPSGSTVSGTATLTGDGSLTAAGAPAFPVPAGFSGAGTLAASGVPTPTATPGLSGSGSLAASGTPAIVASAALTGSGTLTTTAIPSPTGAATFTGAGALTAVATLVTATGTAALSGDGVLSTTAVPATSGTVGFTGAGQLTAGGTPGLVQLVYLTGVGVLTAVGHVVSANTRGYSTLTTAARGGSASGARRVGSSSTSAHTVGSSIGGVS